MYAAGFRVVGISPIFQVRINIGHEERLLIFAGKTRIQLGEIPERRRVRGWKGNLEFRKGNFITKIARTGWNKGIRGQNVGGDCISSVCFSYKDSFPLSLL